jgi:hypothetical protein
MTKRVVVALLVGAVGLSLSSGLVAQQRVTIDDRAVSLSRLVSRQVNPEIGITLSGKPILKPPSPLTSATGAATWTP